MPAAYSSDSSSTKTLTSAPMLGAQTQRKHILLLLLSIVVLILVMAASLMFGAKAIPLSVVWQSLLGESHGADSILILESRLPRTLIGVLAGAALGLSGAVIQALTRNPLADPGILGMNAGASFAVVISIIAFGANAISGYMVAAFIGTLITTLLVYWVGSMGGGRVSPLRLTLSGVAIGAVLTGITSGIALTHPQIYDSIRFWQAGTLDIRNMSVVMAVTPVIIVGSVIALLLARSLNAMHMGDDLAAAIGARIGRTQFWAVVAITLLCGGATAAVGPIAFVGLMVPHIARWIVGPNQVWILPFTLVMTPILLLVSDIVGRFLVPGELRVSIVTAFIGAPLLIWLVRSNKRMSTL
ncbi:Fe(3+)-siderophore ABC transporter permease [Yersinia massiliensis]|uniref:Fe(3+)-siderophore ABC transporter permease n=1 Tax=Yersinia massiliensis TaxID=419257 RepID=A0ABM6UPH9_9GAMM|nr:Fe(3+)-siderophore ABC transporter permease [Yersinia massiliensis]AVX36727.1 Fe(3+)-siderophore ABC transporter permease [Yersinia massiliensis]QKJ11526.1 Fe(3+)-siderophore ABC transporter permease [Yersinia massiliensis]